MCGREISRANSTNEPESAFVTQMQIQYEGFPPCYSRGWVCQSCFGEFGPTMNWQLLEGELPELPEAESREFTRAWNLHMREQQRLKRPGWLTEHPYAQTGWSVDDIVGIARIHGLTVSRRAAQALLEQNEGKLCSAMDRAVAHEVLCILREGNAEEDPGLAPQRGSSPGTRRATRKRPKGRVNPEEPGIDPT